MKTVNLIPLAGNSKRFFDKGYLTPKQFIHIDGVPMFIKAELSVEPLFTITNSILRFIFFFTIIFNLFNKLNRFSDSL